MKQLFNLLLFFSLLVPLKGMALTISDKNEKRLMDDLSSSLYSRQIKAIQDLKKTKTANPQIHKKLAWLLLYSENIFIKTSSADALGSLRAKHSEIYQALFEALSYVDINVRITAAIALMKIYGDNQSLRRKWAKALISSAKTKKKKSKLELLLLYLLTPHPGGFFFPEETRLKLFSALSGPGEAIWDDCHKNFIH